MKNLLTYRTIYDDIKKFRNIGDNEGRNLYEQPSTLYFKVMFFFSNNGDSNWDNTSNLLGLNYDKDTVAGKPVNNWEGAGKSNEYVGANTAYNYLLINNELERAEYLRQFILLLSDISSNTPWLFNKLTGLNEAMNKSFFTEAKVPDARDITIGCMDDTIDKRLSTLIYLYKSACFDYINKREVVPANLRKFDMGVYLYSSPIKNLHGNLEGKDVAIKGIVEHTDFNDSVYFTSCNYYEFQNCEFDINSMNESFSEISNEEGANISCNIKIRYDDCLETIYNEFMAMTIGDFVLRDIYSNVTDDDVKKMRLSDVNQEGRQLALSDKKKSETNTATNAHGKKQDAKNGGADGESENSDIKSAWGEYFSELGSKYSGLFQSYNINADKRDAIKEAFSKDKVVSSLNNMGQQVVSQVSDRVYDEINSRLLGNAHRLSISELHSNMNNAFNGDGTVNLAQLTSGIKETVTDLGNIEGKIKRGRLY